MDSDDAQHEPRGDAKGKRYFWRDQQLTAGAIIMSIMISSIAMATINGSS